MNLFFSARMTLVVHVVGRRSLLCWQPSMAMRSTLAGQPIRFARQANITHADAGRQAHHIRSIWTVGIAGLFSKEALIVPSRSQDQLVTRPWGHISPKSATIAIHSLTEDIFHQSVKSVIITFSRIIMFSTLIIYIYIIFLVHIQYYLIGR